MVAGEDRGPLVGDVLLALDPRAEEQPQDRAEDDRLQHPVEQPAHLHPDDGRPADAVHSTTLCAGGASCEDAPDTGRDDQERAVAWPILPRGRALRPRRVRHRRAARATGSPAPRRACAPWGEYLADLGYTVRMPRLPGHGTTWQEMNRTRWEDWYAAVDTAFRELHEQLRRRSSSAACRWAARSRSGWRRTTARGSPGLVLVNPAIKFEDRAAASRCPCSSTWSARCPGIANDIKKPGVTELGYTRTPLKAGHSQIVAWRSSSATCPRSPSRCCCCARRRTTSCPPRARRCCCRRISSQDVTEVLLEDTYHVATLDNDAPRIFAESADFIERVTR